MVEMLLLVEMWSKCEFKCQWLKSIKIGGVKEPTIRGVSHYGLAIYLKKYLKAKEELWKLKYFTIQKYNLQKIL